MFCFIIISGDISVFFVHLCLHVAEGVHGHGERECLENFKYGNLWLFNYWLELASILIRLHVE